MAASVVIIAILSRLFEVYASCRVTRCRLVRNGRAIRREKTIEETTIATKPNRFPFFKMISHFLCLGMFPDQSLIWCVKRDFPHKESSAVQSQKLIVRQSIAANAIVNHGTIQCQPHRSPLEGSEVCHGNYHGR